MAKYNNLKLGTFLKKPPTEFFALILIWLLEPQSNGGWRKLGRVLTKMKKKFRGGVYERCQIIHLLLITLSNCSNHNHTPPLNFFFIFVRTRQKYFLCDFYGGPNSHISKIAKTSVGGFLRKCLKLNKKKRERYHKIFKNLAQMALIR